MNSGLNLSVRSPCKGTLMLALLGAVALFTPFRAAQAQSFGNTEVGTIPSNGLSADYKRGSKFTLSEPGTVKDVCAYLDGQGGVSGQQVVRYAIYGDASGTPSNKVAESAPYTVRSGEPTRWICNSTGNVALSAGNYWLVIHSGGVAGVVRNYSTGPANWYGNADAYSDGASNTFGAGTAGTGTISIYAYFETAQMLSNAGRTTVGATASNGLTANYKRASAFTLTQPGRLDSLSAYLDGRGGATGTQDLRFVLYRDANGVPGTKVTESLPMSFASDFNARWVSPAAPPYLLDAGRYWVALHTGGTAGVLRDYGGDGGNNYYANSDLFADGASSPFGSGAAGTGTLSAFMSYRTGQFQTRSVGQLDVGPVPSAGLTANRTRGSYFFFGDEDAVVTALYAYLDGNGGAAGSQQLRMAVYGADKSSRPVGVRYVLTETVTIQAGQPPGWVRFPVVEPAYLQQSYGFFIMIHSGDTGGVARDYGGGPANNWVGGPDNFADGTDTSLQGWSNGTGTLSVKAEYNTRTP